MVVTLTEKVRFYESVFGAGRMPRNCKNFDVRCPICDPKDASKKKLAIHVDDDRLHCWSCGYKAHNLVPLIKKYGTKEQLIEYRDRFMPDTGYRSRNNIDDWLDGQKEPEKLKLPDDFKLLATAHPRDPDVIAIKKYLVTRRVSESDVWYFKLGYSHQLKWKRRVIMPSFDRNGDLNHYVARAIDKYKKPKYEAPEGERRHIIFNEINIDWGKQLVLCEGSFDLMKCGENAVPLLGSDLNEQSALFSEIIVHGTPIVLALDNDMKLTKTQRIAKKLMDYDVALTMVNVATDPGDMSKYEFREALKAAQPFDWQQTFLDKLENAARVSL